MSRESWKEVIVDSEFFFSSDSWLLAPVRAGFEQKSIDVSRESFDKTAPTTPDSCTGGFPK